jgi:hypothetical protein
VVGAESGIGSHQVTLRLVFVYLATQNGQLILRQVARTLVLNLLPPSLPRNLVRRSACRLSHPASTLLPACSNRAGGCRR